MNRPIRRVAVFVALMFFALLANATWLSVARPDELNSEPRNRRTREAEFATDRGAILVGNRPIAETKASPKDRFGYTRNYPGKDVYAAVTGYYSYDYARTGLEQAYNSQLAGTDDSQFFDRVVGVFTGTKPAGASVLTTIDSRAQKAAVQALGDRKGAVVAMDYTTGAVKALATSPSYDPNQLATTDLAAAAKAWQKLNADEDRPMSNRATREIYPPGSTFKLVTAAAALENGMKADSTVDSPSSMVLPGTRTTLPNAGNCGGTKITLAQALKTSCNTAFANLGLQVGDAKLRAQAEKFGFGTAFAEDLDSVTSRFPTEVNKPQLAMSAIGQFEVAATPLQMAVVTAAIANDGKVMEPYLVQEVRSRDLSVLSSHKPTELQEAMSSENAKTLQEMMVGVVDGGTGSRAKIWGQRIGGKTGTAQTDKVRANYSWFVGFSTERKLAVAVFVEDPGASGETGGGRVAAPIFRSVVEAVG